MQRPPLSRRGRCFFYAPLSRQGAARTMAQAITGPLK